MEDKFVKDLSLFTSTMVVIPVIAFLVLSFEGEFDVDPMASSPSPIVALEVSS